MPLRPLIPLAAAPNRKDILAPLESGMRLKSIGQSQQLAEIQLEEATRQQTENKRLRDVTATHAASGTLGGKQYLRDVAGVSANAYDQERKAQQDYLKAQIGLKKAMADLLKNELNVQSAIIEQADDLNEFMMQKIGACIEGDQACYDRSKAETIQHIQALPLQPEVKKIALAKILSLPELMDKQLLNEYRMQGLSVKEQLAESRQGIDYKRREIEETAVAKAEAERLKWEATLPSRKEMVRTASRMLTTDSGFATMDPMTGEVTPVIGPAGEQVQPRPTAEQSKAMTFGMRTLAANDILVRLEDKGISSADPKTQLSGIPFIGNYLLTEELQQYEQAKLDFLNAVLRKESGAAIGRGEIASGNRQYFPQPGDTPGTIAQKRANREQAIAGIEKESGRNLTPKGTVTQGPITEAPASDDQSEKNRLLDKYLKPGAR